VDTPERVAVTLNVSYEPGLLAGVTAVSAVASAVHVVVSDVPARHRVAMVTADAPDRGTRAEMLSRASPALTTGESHTGALPQLARETAWKAFGACGYALARD
jgi:hypothetical protein